MLYYLTTFALIFYLPAATLAIGCIECYQKLNLNSSEVLNTTRSECMTKYQSGDMCLATLFIDFENKTASVSLDNYPDQALILSNANKITIDTITISFNKNIGLQSIQLIGIDSQAGAEDLNKTYNKMKNFKYEELRTKLRGSLYAGILNVFNLTCSDNEGQTLSCPNGFCQLTRKGISIVDRRCIPQGEGTNPSGIIISSNSIEGPNAEATFIYACNKAMCNGAETDTQVRQLLIEYGLLPSSDNISQVIATTTPTVTNTGTSTSTETTTASTVTNVGTSTSTGTPTSPTVTNTGTPTTPTVTNTGTSTSTGTTTPPPGNSAMTTVHQTIMNFQWMFILIITNLLKI